MAKCDITELCLKCLRPKKFHMGALLSLLGWKKKSLQNIAKLSYTLRNINNGHKDHREQQKPVETKALRVTEARGSDGAEVQEWEAKVGRKLKTVEANDEFHHRVICSYE